MSIALDAGACSPVAWLSNEKKKGHRPSSMPDDVWGGGWGEDGQARHASGERWEAREIEDGEDVHYLASFTAATSTYTWVSPTSLLPQFSLYGMCGKQERCK